MEINLLIIATNKYTEFLPGLIKSCEQFFCPGKKVIYNIFTDKPYEVRERFISLVEKTRIFQIEHLPWPGATLYRFHFFKRYLDKIPGDYYFYIDADCLIKNTIFHQEIIGDRVGVQHCGFVGKRGSYEQRPTSAAYIGPDEGSVYFGGGFWGFSKEEFPKVIERAIEIISTDASNGITPEHNDESVLNRYFVDNPPTRILTPSFHYPQGNKNKKTWPQEYPCKILLLDKDHSKYQV